MSEGDAETPPSGSPAIRAVGMPADTNPYGDIFGGWLMSPMDSAAGTVAALHSKGRAVTIAVDGMTFHRPVKLGDVVSVYAECRLGRPFLDEDRRRRLGPHPHAMDVRNIPGCTYCHPQIASVGLTEAKAKEAGYEVKVGNFPFIGNGKAIALGEPEGFVKTVFDAKTGELLGAHMIGAEVTEMIQGYVVGKTLETTEAELIETVFPHPTISETMHEAVLAAYGHALHY